MLAVDVRFVTIFTETYLAPGFDGWYYSASPIDGIAPEQQPIESDNRVFKCDHVIPSPLSVTEFFADGLEGRLVRMAGRKGNQFKRDFTLTRTQLSEIQTKMLPEGVVDRALALLHSASTNWKKARNGRFYANTTGCDLEISDIRVQEFTASSTWTKILSSLQSLLKPSQAQVQRRGTMQ